MIGRFALACLDMAGTTVRDDGAVESAFEAALVAVGIEPGSLRHDEARALVLETMGWSKADVFAALLDAEAAARATAAFAVAYEQTVADGGIQEMAGALDVMRELRAAGVQVCLSTGFAPSTRDALLDALGWRSEIDLALSPADVGRGRPAPDLILGAMERLGVRGPGRRGRGGRHGQRSAGGHGGPRRRGDRRAQRRPRPGHPRGGAPHGPHSGHQGTDRAVASLLTRGSRQKMKRVL